MNKKKYKHKKMYKNIKFHIIRKLQNTIFFVEFYIQRIKFLL